jgi:hypothetical protein
MHSNQVDVENIQRLGAIYHNIYYIDEKFALVIDLGLHENMEFRRRLRTLIHSNDELQPDRTPVMPYASTVNGVCGAKLQKVALFFTSAVTARKLPGFLVIDT